MVTHKCENCGYTTNRKGSLTRHLKRKRPCIKVENTCSETLRNDTKLPPKYSIALQNNTKPPSIKIKCQFCDKTFSRKDNLNRHINFKRCKIKSNVDNLRLEVELMKKEMKKLKNKKPIIVNNNNIYINIPMDDLAIKDVFESFFSVDEFYKGPDAIVDMLYETLFQKNIKLLDIARQIFQYKTNDKVIKDIKNYKVLSKIAGQYKKHVGDFVRYETMRHTDNIGMIQEITETGMKHQKAIDNLNQWSDIWVKTVGQ
jgi:predicted lactoylglutathione lyase